MSSEQESGEQVFLTEQEESNEGKGAEGTLEEVTKETANALFGNQESESNESSQPPQNNTNPSYKSQQEAVQPVDMSDMHETSGDLISITNFEEKCGNGIPTITEKETILAMRRLGYINEDLKKITDADVSKFPNVPEVRDHVKEVLNNRRQQKINQIAKERENIFNNTKEEETVSLDQTEAEQKLEKELKEHEEQEQKRLEKMQKKN